MIERVIPYCSSIYQIAYFGKKEFKSENKFTLVYAIELVLRYKNENKKRELLGDETYIEYLKYRNQMDTYGLNAFSEIFDFMCSEKTDLDENDKVNLLENLIEQKEISKETIIAANLLKNTNHFSVEEFEKLLPVYEKQDKAFKN